MNVFQRFMRQSGLLPKVFMGIAITSAAVVAHRMWSGPYFRRQRYKKAEAWAEMIIEQEEQDK